jgi:hypothetical protein
MKVAGLTRSPIFSDTEDLFGLAGGLTVADLSITGNPDPNSPGTTIAIAATGEVLANVNGVNFNLITAEDFTLIG